MARRALITGVGGQDGSYLADLLIAENYEVFGFDRLPLAEHYKNLAAVRDCVDIVQANLVGDLSKARRELGWSPSVDFEGLVQMLADAELARLDGASPASEKPRTEAL